eukprot:3996341-Prymnesium_polylepis.1
MRQRHVYTGRAGRHTAHTRASALDTSVRPPITIYNMYRSKATTSQSPIASHVWRRAKYRLGPGLQVSLIAARFFECKTRRLL